MATRAQKIELGLFVIVAASVAVLLLVTFAAASPFDKRARYDVLVPDAGGVEVGAAVAMRGVHVGEVTAIELFAPDPERVRVVMAVDRHVAIPGDARAYLEFAGLTGRKSVNIRDGTSQAAPYPPGATLEAGSTMFDKLPDQTTQLLADATSLIRTTNQLVESISIAAAQIDPARVDTILATTEELMTSLTNTSGELQALVKDARAPLQQSVETANHTLAAVEKLVARVDRVVANLDTAVVSVRGLVTDNQGDMRATMRSLRGATRELQGLSRELRRQPSRLLFGSAPKPRELP